MTKKIKNAFTLAEVLITLSIIGIVAALIIPGLVRNHNERAWNANKDLLQKKLVETTRRMNIDGVMNGYSTTESYFDVFKKYTKIIKTCDNTDLSKCYSATIIKDDGEEISVSDLKTSSDIGKAAWKTNTIGFVMNNGTTGIMAYNPNCATVDPFSQVGQAGQVGCMAMILDVNGKKGPNKVGKDILLNGAVFPGCDAKYEGFCLAKPFKAEPIDTCTDLTWDPHGNELPDCSTNYWAGARKACADMGMSLISEILAHTWEDDKPIFTYDRNSEKYVCAKAEYEDVCNLFGASNARATVWVDSEETCLGEYGLDNMSCAHHTALGGWNCYFTIKSNPYLWTVCAR